MSLSTLSNSCAPCCGPDVIGAHLALAQFPSGNSRDAGRARIYLGMQECKP